MDSKVSLILKIVLAVVIIYLGYLLYSIIQEPIQFEKLKTKRYTLVQNRLEQIRDAQKAYRAEYSKFADDFNGLIAFVDTGKQSIIERKDSSFTYYNKTYQQEMVKDTIVTKLLGYQPVKKNLFGEDFDASQLRYIPTTEGKEFEMSATKIKVNDVIVPVFEAKATNEQIFGDVWKKYDQFIDKEYALTVGSLTEPTLSGNWK
ncbi:MAG: hypothetical protein CMI36_05750 [Owenweeksia sp.]|nr:hypothetical protein [Owenweeksia sp.]MBF98472.1 hypothetical protein [Owenweeksia sp.]HBF19662.1 hypothetical protein [Cryomorphaceae bacterium]|tara:strand:+ start:1752 stop:2360 length:609 start_codon:yes stop_codon:yes gene_type:complete